MALDGKTPGSTLPDDISRFENIIADGNPLYPKFKLLLESYKKLARHAEGLVHENGLLGIQLVELNRSLELATRVDPMTGLANRRHIKEKVEQEYSRAQRHNRTFSIILADIDNFTRINDSYGYNAGDDVLVEISRVFMGCVRQEDVCARWGGEEFLILLPETSIEGALAVAQKIHESVAMTEFKASKPGIRTTISIGLSEYTPGQALFECVNRADHALQQAKKSGKNRYIAEP
ncbi:GGDEF domain-containing protein [Geobacter sp. FeAm09]|uniref:GGDEF domain-containing protein n=1 Tax=Geobacter sp. FeAm09 TaxID=2597769 RepID=UPI00143D1E7D|nr:GGDEF domain-containing protein [Geobacter sp. FeAm09]